MKIRLEHGLAYVEAILTFRGRSLLLRDTSTFFAADRLLEIGVAPEPTDALHRLRGIGGTEYAFTKRDLKAPDFEIEVGAMDYGFPADGIPMPWLGKQAKFSMRPGRSRELQTVQNRTSELSRPYRPPWLLCSPSQGIGLRPQPWARLSRPVGPVLLGTLSQGRMPGERPLGGQWLIEPASGVEHHHLDGPLDVAVRRLKGA